MYKIIALAVIFVVSTPVFEALKCPTCRGEYCDNEIIYELDCTKFLTSLALPHNIYSEGHEEKDSEYACMDLEYNLIGYDSMKIKQCFIIKRERDVCGQIEKSLAKRETLQKCVVTLEDKIVDSNTTTTEKTTTTSKTTPPPTTTEVTTTTPTTTEATTTTPTTTEATTTTPTTTEATTTTPTTTEATTTTPITTPSTTIATTTTVYTTTVSTTTTPTTTTVVNITTPEEGGAGIASHPHRLPLLMLISTWFIHIRI